MPPRSSDGSLCISVLDGDGRGSCYHVRSNVGGPPLSNTTARVLNCSMEERNDNSSLYSDSTCSSSITSRSNVNTTDLKSLQEKVGIVTDQCNYWMLY